MVLSEDNTIHFNSKAVFYAKERSGKKPNTIRLLSGTEALRLEVWRRERGIKEIVIHCAEDPWEYFRRKLIDITCVGEILGRYLYVFSWEHKEEQNGREKHKEVRHEGD